MKKLLIFGAMLLGITNVSASEQFVQDDIIYNSFDEYKETLCQSSLEFGNIIFRDNNEFNNKEIYYYCEFENPTKALSDFKKNYSGQLKEIQEKNHLETLNDNNWKDYFDAAMKDLNENNLKIAVFFDTYENTLANDEITNAINSYNHSSDNELALNRIDKLLPDYNNKFSTLSTNAQKFNVSAGVKYAEEWAWDYNPGFRVFSGSDCTNFVSQVLQNGGYNHVWGVNKYFGWWYNDSENSNSWSAADNFIKYWGVKTYTTNFSEFSEIVTVGDFIFQDVNNDGNYNHAGFVTYTSNNRIMLDHGTYSTIYYDFIVAQHSNNYNKWVSESDNNWENCDTCRYAIANINKG